MPDSTPKTMPLRYGYCTGCGCAFNQGPYFVRRVRRHLNDGHHNHDAVALVYPGRRVVLAKARGETDAG